MTTSSHRNGSKAVAAAVLAQIRFVWPHQLQPRLQHQLQQPAISLQPPGGLVGCASQSQNTGRRPLQPLGGLNEPTPTPLPAASLPQHQWS